MRDSMVFYRSFYEAMKDLDPETFKEVTSAIFEYAMDGKIPELYGISKMVFTLIKPQIDANNKRAENGKYGVLGGRPKKTQRVSDEKPIGFESENPNVNVNVNENVNVNNRQKNKFNSFPQKDLDMEALKTKVFIN